MVIGVTGGTGGLGKTLTEYLLSKGYELKVLARKTSDVNDLVKLGVEIVYGDINEPESLIEFVKGVDICYHLAAQVSSASKEILFKVNAEGTKNICEAIIKHNKACRLIYCSSIVVKGVRPYNKAFLSNYTLSKYCAEKIVDSYMENDDFKATIVYPGYIYGPNDKNFMPLVIKILKGGLKFAVKGGEKNAPVIYIDDLCELLHLAGSKNIAIGKKYVSLRESNIGMHGFLKIIADKMNYTFPKKIYPKIPLVIFAFAINKVNKLFNAKASPKLNMRLIGVLSNSAKYFNVDAVRELNWNHKTSISEGIDKSIEWYRRNVEEI